MSEAATARRSETITIHVPMSFQRHGGRKLIIGPDGKAPVTDEAAGRKQDQTLINAIVKAHRWRRRIENGQAKSITDLAAQESVTDAYVCRILPLTCLSPHVVSTILDGHYDYAPSLTELVKRLPLDWDEQSELGR